MSRKFLNRLYLTLLAAVIGSVSAYAQNLHSLTADQAIELAKKNNISVKAALTNLAIQEQTNKEVTALALPNVKGTAGTTDYFNIPVTLVPGEFFQQPPGTYYPVAFQQKYIASGGFNLTQTLFDGSVFVGLKARQSALDYYKKAIDLTVEDLSVQVYKTYYQLVVSSTQIQLEDSNIARAAKLLHDTKVMNENGFVEKLDVDKAEVQLTNFQIQKQNTSTTIANGFTLLKFLIGIPATDSIVLTSQFNEADLKGGVPMDIEYSYKNRFDYQSLEIQKQLNDFDIKRYQAAYYPTLKLNGAYQKNAANNTYDLFSKTGTWFTTSYLGLSLDVPIFEGFAKNARLKKARLTSTLTSDEMENLKLNIGQQVAVAKNNFINAIQTMDAQKINMDRAESVYKQVKKKFESGLATNTDLSSSQSDLIIAQSSYLNALYNAVISKVDFLKAIGKI
ncbi:MAG TPA: TolC family protein [Puia sp.]|nr:TolC family protein [Puia sp.]